MAAISAEEAIQRRAAQVHFEIGRLGRWAQLAHFRLCNLMLRYGCGLENDDTYLGDVSGVRGWKKVRKALIENGGFFVAEDGLFWNRRVRHELEAVRVVRKQRSDAAKEGQKKRQSGAPDGRQRELLGVVEGGGEPESGSGKVSGKGPSADLDGSVNWGFADHAAGLVVASSAAFVDISTVDLVSIESVGHAASKPKSISGDGPSGDRLARAGDSRIYDDDDDSLSRSSSEKTSSSSSSSPGPARAARGASAAETGPPLPQTELKAAAEQLADAFFAARRKAFPGDERGPSRGKTVATATEIIVEHADREALDDDVRAMAAALDDATAKLVMGGKAPPNSIAFCRAQMQNAAADAARRRREGSGKRAAADALPPRKEIPWAHIVMPAYRKNGFWKPEYWGPKPGELGCRVPDELLTAEEIAAKRSAPPSIGAVA